MDNLPNDLAEKGYGIIRENIGKFQSPFSTGYATTPNETPNSQTSNLATARNPFCRQYFFFNAGFYLIKIKLISDLTEGVIFRSCQDPFFNPFLNFKELKR